VRSRYLLVAADEPTWQSAADLAREQFAR